MILPCSIHLSNVLVLICSKLSLLGTDKPLCLSTTSSLSLLLWPACYIGMLSCNCWFPSCRSSTGSYWPSTVGRQRRLQIGGSHYSERRSLSESRMRRHRLGRSLKCRWLRPVPSLLHLWPTLQPLRLPASYSPLPLSLFPQESNKFHLCRWIGRRGQLVRQWRRQADPRCRWLSTALKLLAWRLGPLCHPCPDPSMSESGSSIDENHSGLTISFCRCFCEGSTFGRAWFGWCDGSCWAETGFTASALWPSASRSASCSAALGSWTPGSHNLPWSTP